MDILRSLLGQAAGLRGVRCQGPWKHTLPSHKGCLSLLGEGGKGTMLSSRIKLTNQDVVLKL